MISDEYNKSVLNSQEFKLPNNINIKITKFECENKIKKFYSFISEIYTNDKWEECGSLTYYIMSSPNSKDKDVWFMNIEVDKKFEKLGIGGKLLEVFEEDLLKQGIENIVGKYYPTRDGDGVKQFYENRGYIVTQFDQGDWEVSKTLSYTKQKEKRFDL